MIRTNLHDLMEVRITGITATHHTSSISFSKARCVEYIYCCIHMYSMYVNNFCMFLIYIVNLPETSFTSSLGFLNFYVDSSELGVPILGRVSYKGVSYI